MCGIAGFFGNSDNFNAKQCGDILAQSLKHRGPDDCGIWTDAQRSCLLVHRRLSIIDPSDSGHQPMRDETGRYGIVYNGEIYNFREIREQLEQEGYWFSSQTDTEVVLHAYRQWGTECLSRFVGMFAFAILDKSGKVPKLFLARDRFGIKPLIYSRARDLFVFSSELQALVDARLIDQTVSMQALGQYFSRGAIAQPYTIYDGVFHLLPGHYMVVSRDEIDIQRWYDVREPSVRLANAYTKCTYEDLVELTRLKLEGAVKRHIVSDVEVGAFLSGGLDSSSIVALMQRHLPHKIKTFSIGFDNQSDVYDERDDARRIAGLLDTEHHGITITRQQAAKDFDMFIASLDQPSIDGFNTFLVSQYAARQVKVVLSGLGGDELFGGYSYFRDILRFSKFPFGFFGKIFSRWENRLPLRLVKMFAYNGLNPYEAVKAFRRYHSSAWLKQTTRLKMGDDAPEEFCDDERLGRLSRMGLAELDGYLRSMLLRDNDVLSMAYALEVRPVLLDHELVEHALALTDVHKCYGKRLKRIFIDATAHVIPGRFRQQKKAGFELPFNQWMRSSLKGRLMRMLETDCAQQLFQPDFLNRLRARAGSGRVNRWHWQWFVLLSWLEKSGVELKI